MPDRIKVFLAHTRKPIPPPVATARAFRPVQKPMTEKWAEYKRDQDKLRKENSSGSQLQA
jgi:hypothetical protein